MCCPYSSQQHRVVNFVASRTSSQLACASPFLGVELTMAASSQTDLGPSLSRPSSRGGLKAESGSFPLRHSLRGSLQDSIVLQGFLEKRAVVSTVDTPPHLHFHSLSSACNCTLTAAVTYWAHPLLPNSSCCPILLLSDPPAGSPPRSGKTGSVAGLCCDATKTTRGYLGTRLLIRGVNLRALCLSCHRRSSRRIVLACAV